MNFALKNAVTLTSFSELEDAAGYLEDKGFTFQGAPERWLHVEEEGPVYARIVPSQGGFFIHICRSERQP